jgi:diaminohydroxyphosphoribosylaminopyrimidine deaminase/5-amino-6-(5-phosphoribosylamino)uracil reductase
VARLLSELAVKARVSRFEVAPNPSVGAAILARGRVIARGFHRFWGGPHAEVEAICEADASGIPRAEWDSIVVTLEPCSSTGKTPPCARAILKAGIGHVIIGALDPDARHSGAGLELLRDAGVAVDFYGSRPDEPDSWSLETTAPHFVRWTSYERLRRPRPWVIAKWAQTLTGQLSPPSHVGDGRWISGPDSRAEVQVLRGRVDAILTGVGTVRADDPRLTVRAPGDTSRPPLRVVFDSYLTTAPGAALFAPLESSAAAAGEEAKGDVVILCKSGPDPARYRALEKAGARVVTLPGGDDGRISLRAAADWLWEAGVRRALLEAGPTLIEAFHEAELLDQVRVYSGSVVGGEGETLAPLVRTLVDRDRLSEDRLDRECGDDAVLELFG